MRAGLKRAGTITAAVASAAAVVTAVQTGAAAKTPPLADTVAIVYDSADPVARGGTVTYTVIVWNHVPDGIVGEDAKHAGAFLSANGTRISTITPPPGGRCFANKGSIMGFHCSLGTIPPRKSVTIRATVKAPNKAARRATTIGLNADVYSALVDPDMYNNSDTESTIVR